MKPSGLLTVAAAATSTLLTSAAALAQVEEMSASVMCLYPSPWDPNPGGAIELCARGAWASTCVPNQATLTLGGMNFVLDLHLVYAPGTGCNDVVTNWEACDLWYSEAGLADGIYSVSTVLHTADGPLQQDHGRLMIFCSAPYGAVVQCTEEGALVGLALSGTWSNGCVPNAPSITITNDNILLRVDTDYQPDHPCNDAVTRWHASTITGPLAPGVYNVTTQIRDEPPIQRPAVVIEPCPATCPADWNDDGDVNSQDISAFISSWLSSVTNGDLLADFNGDGLVNSDDISAFITAWLDAVMDGC